MFKVATVEQKYLAYLWLLELISGRLLQTGIVVFLTLKYNYE